MSGRTHRQSPLWNGPKHTGGLILQEEYELQAKKTKHLQQNNHSRGPNTFNGSLQGFQGWTCPCQVTRCSRAPVVVGPGIDLAGCEWYDGDLRPMALEVAEKARAACETVLGALLSPLCNSC